MHHADAGIERVHGTAEVHFLSVYQNFSFIAAGFLNDAHAEKDVHQGGLARPVLSDKAEDASFAEGEIDVFEHPVGKVRLADAFYSEQWFFCAHRTSCAGDVSPPTCGSGKKEKNGET